MSRDGAYWDAATGGHRQRGGLWRQHCDALHRGLLEDWLAGRRSCRALKTDLFDESTHDGLAPVLSRAANAVYGVDISTEVVRAATAGHPGLRAGRADVRSLPFATGAFDLVVSNSTLDHFEARSDIGAALGELRRVSGPEGRLVITLDNPTNPVVRLRSALPLVLLQRLRIVPYYVGATLSGEELEAELAVAGYRVVRTRTLFHAPRVVAMAACRLVDRVGSPRAGRALLRVLNAAERLDRLPSRRWTAYYVAALAVPAGP